MKVDFYLEQTLLKMLEKQNINEIFVVDIIKKTGTCKGSFYKYYCDKFDCNVRAFQRFIYKDMDKAASWNEFLTDLLTVFSKNASVVINSFAPVSVFNSVRDYNDRFIGDMYVKLCTDGRPVNMRLVKAYAAEITNIACGWLIAGHSEAVSSLVGFIRNMLPVGLANL